MLGRNNPPSRQVGLIFTAVDSNDVLSQLGAGRYRITRLDAVTHQPDAPTPSSVDLDIISVQAALQSMIGPEVPVGNAVFMHVTGADNYQGDRTSTAPFGVRIAGLPGGRTRFAGTLYATRQDDEAIEALVQSAGQEFYSAERMYLTRFAPDVRPGQTFTAEQRRWTITAIRRVARRHLLVAADSIT